MLFASVLLITLFLVLFPVVLLVFYSFSVGTPNEPLRLGLDAWRNAVGHSSGFFSNATTSGYRRSTGPRRPWALSEGRAPSHR